MGKLVFEELGDDGIFEARDDRGCGVGCDCCDDVAEDCVGCEDEG